MFIFNTLAPIFVLISVGALAFHCGFLDPPTLRGIQRLTYWIALPALLFHGAVSADYTRGGIGPTLGALILASALTGFAAIVVAP